MNFKCVGRSAASAVLVLSLLFAGYAGLPENTYAAKASDAYVYDLKATVYTDQSDVQQDLYEAGYRKVKVSWKPSGKVSKYVIYSYRNKKYRRLRTVKTTSAVLYLKKKNNFIKVRPYYGTAKGKLSHWVSVRPGKKNATEVTVTKRYKKMIIGVSRYFKASANGTVTDNVRWSSSNPAIAKVNKKGYVTAVSEGQVVITATAHSGYSESMTVNVVPRYPAKVTISGANARNVGKAKYITLKATTSNAYYSEIVWSSADPTIATVSSTGKVTGKTVGTTTVTAIASGGAKDSVKITVIPGIEGMVQWAEKVAKNDSYGYCSIPAVKGADRYCYTCNHNNSKDYDCASFVMAAVAHGYGLSAAKSTCKSGAPGCGGLYSFLIANGWKDKGFMTTSNLKRGDILINTSSHVEIYAGNGNNVGAHDDYNGKPGDGNGREINIQNNHYFYTTVLRR